jgi:hypothetical protein
MSTTRLPWLSVLGAVVWTAAPPVPAADPFTAGVLTCAAETDRDRRLECYDHAVASYTAGLSNGKRDLSTGPSATSAPGSTTAGSAVRSTGATAAAESPAPVSGSVTAAPAGKAASSAVRHVSARIVSIDHFPDYVVVHLDNQQIWKQVSDSSGSLILRKGDPVTIDREMGSYWLSGPKGEAVQVKLETSKP